MKAKLFLESGRLFKLCNEVHLVSAHVSDNIDEFLDRFEKVVEETASSIALYETSRERAFVKSLIIAHVIATTDYTFRKLRQEHDKTFTRHWGSRSAEDSMHYFQVSQKIVEHQEKTRKRFVVV